MEINEFILFIIVNGYGAIEQRMSKILKFIHKTRSVSISLFEQFLFVLFVLNPPPIECFFLLRLFLKRILLTLSLYHYLLNSSKQRISAAKLQFVIILYDTEEYPRRVNGNFIYMLLPPMSCIAHNDLSRFVRDAKRIIAFVHRILLLFSTRLLLIICCMSERERVYMDVSFAITMIGIIYVAVDK